MQLRYDFETSLDLSKFEKQIPVYIHRLNYMAMENLLIDVFVKGYKLSFNITSDLDVKSNNIEISLFEILRNKDGDLTSGTKLIPANDIRFADIKVFSDLFCPNDYSACFVSSDIDLIRERMCTLIKIVHKINKLKMFY